MQLFRGQIVRGGRVVAARVAGVINPEGGSDTGYDHLPAETRGRAWAGAFCLPPDATVEFDSASQCVLVLEDGRRVDVLIREADGNLVLFTGLGEFPRALSSARPSSIEAR